MREGKAACRAHCPMRAELADLSIRRPISRAPVGCGGLVLARDGNGYPKPEYPTGITR
jgi:hypothetical protein